MTRRSDTRSIWPDERDAEFRMHASAGKCAREIAEIMGLSIQSVGAKSRFESIPLAQAKPGSGYEYQPAQPLEPVWFPMFEDVPRETVQREWPIERFWSWRHLLKPRGDFSYTGNSGAMCAA